VLFGQSTRQTATFTGSLSTSGVLTVNSGLSGFVASGQWLTFAGSPTRNVVLTGKLSSTTWQTDFSPAVAVSSVAMVTSQTWFSPTATFTGGSATINMTRSWQFETPVSNHTYQVGDQINFPQGTLPSNFSNATNYFVVSVVAGVSIQVSATSGGSPITAAGSGTFTCPQSNIVLFYNVGGTGAKTILSQVCSPLSDFTNSFPTANSALSMGTLTYDATLNAWVLFGGNIARGSVGLDNQVAIEAALTLCTNVGAHPHIVSPFFAIDPATDWWPQLMTYFNTNMPSWMQLRAEGCNELWNTVQPDTQYGIQKATAYSIADPTHWSVGDFQNWYGKTLSVLGQIGSGIFGLGQLGKRYAILGGVQTTTGDPADINNSLPRFASTSYVNAGTVQSPLTGPWGTITFQAVPAANGTTNYVSHIACAQYITGNAYVCNAGTQTASTLAATFNGAQFAGTTSAGLLTVDQFQQRMGVTPSVGDTIWGPGIPLANAVTITNISGTWPNSVLTLSDNTVNIPSDQQFMTATTLSAAQSWLNSLTDTVFNGTISGSNLTVNSIVSGDTIGTSLFNELLIYGGTIAWGTNVFITGGTFPNYTLNTSPGNQTANFSIGLVFSATGVAHLYQAWATWANTNFGIKIIAGYEGGYSNDFGSLGSAVDLMTGWSKQLSSLQTITKQNFDNFRGLGALAYPSGVTGEFPSVFNTTGQWPISDAWSVLNDIYQSPTPPQWNAITAYH
jgi:hypothetical protein